MTTFTPPVSKADPVPVAERIRALPPEKRAELLLRLGRRTTTTSTAGAWITRFGSDPEARLRLFCFPYAGGGTSMFRSWALALPPGVEVCAIQLPGRESRIGEPAYRSMDRLVADLTEGITPYLDRPFAFFGHSMGALVAFEVARQLRRVSSPAPVRLTLAAFRAPHLPSPNIKIHHLCDEVLKVVLRSEGVPERILQNDELMQAMLPTLRADFEACDTYEYTVEAPLACPLSILGGQQDVRIGVDDLEAWRTHGDQTWNLDLFPGGHFFVHSEQGLVLDAIRRDLAEDMKPTRGGHRA